MHGTPQGPASPETQDVLRHVHASYDMTGHAGDVNARSALLPPEYVDASAVLGSSDECVDRLRSIFDLGFERIQIGGPSPDADPSEAGDVWERIATEVVPAARV